MNTGPLWAALALFCVVALIVWWCHWRYRTKYATLREMHPQRWR